MRASAIARCSLQTTHRIFVSTAAATLKKGANSYVNLCENASVGHWCANARLQSQSRFAQDVLIEQRAALVRRSAPGQTLRAASAVLASSPHAELVDALVEYAHVVYGPGCRYTRAGARIASQLLACEDACHVDLSEHDRAEL